MNELDKETLWVSDENAESCAGMWYKWLDNLCYYANVSDPLNLTPAQLEVEMADAIQRLREALKEKIIGNEIYEDALKEYISELMDLREVILAKKNAPKRGTRSTLNLD